MKHEEEEEEEERWRGGFDGFTTTRLGEKTA
jgi:hypothetical protein